jgi:hypothetical protein
VLLIGVLATTPLQWVRIVDSPIGFIGYFHVVAIVMVGVVVLLPELSAASVRIIKATP